MSDINIEVEFQKWAKDKYGKDYKKWMESFNGLHIHSGYIAGAKMARKQLLDEYWEVLEMRGQNLFARVRLFVRNELEKLK